MALEPGTQLGHYEIADPLGKGGMGEVYRARDTKLGREVAIKVLPSELSGDEERLQRLEREARMLAALNHPNIAAIYGLEESGDTRFLVLELVEGDTLADRLKHGALPVADSLKLALQIAEALEAAHEKGVVHRDLKPANIKITPEGRVKVLDFGLAKALIGDQADMNLSNSPTLSMAATQAGIILGTAAYMSPEQASGEVADHRSDVWSFGVVLFEILCGRQLFTGKTASHVMGAVLERSPDWTWLPADLPPRVRFLLERCLEKDARERCQSISEVRAEIQKALSEPTSPSAQPAAEAVSSPLSARLRWVGALAGVAVVAAVAAWALKPGAAIPDRVVTRFSQQLEEGGGFRNAGRDVVAIAPDSSRFVYNTSAGLYLRNMSDLEARVIAGTEGAMTNPFFSPDGEWIGYYDLTSGQLRRIPVGGGASVTLAAVGNPQGASWGADDMVLFGEPEGIMRVPKDGGEPELVVPAADGESLWDPQRLPDGRVLFSAFTLGNAGEISIASPRGNDGDDRTALFEGERAVYLPTGHLVVTDPDASPNALLARAFDLGTLAVGGAVPVVEGVAVGAGKTHFAVSESGSLVYITGTGGVGNGERSLVWVDRDGTEEAIPLPPDAYLSARVSPDGTRVAMSIGDAPERDIWLWDIRTGNRRKLTFDPADDSNPVWAPDGSRIFFESGRSGSNMVYSIPADGGEATPLNLSAGDLVALLPWSVSPDSQKLLLVALYTAEGHTGISAGSIGAGGDLENVLFDEGGYVYNEPVLSPNGQWLAYLEGEIADPRISVRPFPDVQRTQYPVSQTFGMGPVWSGDGSELFYTSGDAIWAAPVEYDPFRIGTPRQLFQRQYLYGNLAAFGPGGRAWDWDAVGQRFLMITVSGATADVGAPEIDAVVNWSEELVERVPVR